MKEKVPNLVQYCFGRLKASFASVIVDAFRDDHSESIVRNISPASTHHIVRFNLQIKSWKETRQIEFDKLDNIKPTVLNACDILSNPFSKQI